MAEVHLTPSGPPETILDDEPIQALVALEAALAVPAPQRHAAISQTVARWPRFLDGWARLGTRRFRTGIEAIDGLRITGRPVMSVMEISSEVHDLAAVNDVMDDRGWHLDRQQGGLHLMLSPYHLQVVDEFLADLADAVAIHGQSRGVEARYGGVAD